VEHGCRALAALDDLAAQGVHQVTVVGRQDDRPPAAPLGCDRRLELGDRPGLQVLRRIVEEEGIRLPNGQHSDGHAHQQAGRQVPHEGVCHVGEAEASERI